MGLDMVLMATKYDAPSAVLDVFAGVSDIASIHTIKVQVGRWRNAYAIHEWFQKTFPSENVDEDMDTDMDDVPEGTIDVNDTEVLETLRSNVQQVLSNPEKASEILPLPSDAWSLKYNDKYLSYLKHTEKILDVALSAPLNGWHITYEWRHDS